MDKELELFLLQARVKVETIQNLVKDELVTVEDLTSASEDLLKSCGISGGQVLRVKDACSQFVKDKNVEEIHSPQSSSDLSFTSTFESSTSSSAKSRPSSAKSRPSSAKSQPSSAKSQPSSAKSSPSSEKSSPSSSAKSSPSSTASSLSSSSSSQLRAFSPCEPLNSKCGPSWLVNFQLPTSFSPAVNKALEEKKLTGNRRNELTRDVCSSIRVHTIYPTKAEREHVAFLLIKKFPFLRDAIGSGIGSWETAFKNRFKNLRKTGLKGEGTSAARCPNYGKGEDEPQPKKRRIEEIISEMPEGETAETCQEHVKAMKKEMARSSNRNLAMVKELMELTHSYRRHWVLKEMVPISSFIGEYPALKTPFGIKAEFARILGRKNPVREMSEAFQQNWVEKILVFAESQHIAKDVVANMKDAVLENPSKKQRIEEAAAVLLLPCLLREKGGNTEDFIKICMEEDSLDDAIKETKFPRIIGSGEFWDMDSLGIAVEGVVVLDLGCTSMATILGLLVACYYVFNIVYPTKCSNAYFFCEAALLDMHQNAKKRVAVNKFISALKL